MKIKIVLSLIALVSAHYSFAKCPTEKTAKEAIVFLDLNNNAKEIEVAKKAACKRGEFLIVMPGKEAENYMEEDGGRGFRTSEIQEKFDWAKKNNIKINSMILSGHDGGGDFGGENGGLTKSDLGRLMAANPDVKETVSSLLLLGCYTGVKKEIFDWKEMFPNANLIAGYEGQAPLGDKPAGHNYIEGLLAKEKELNQAKSKKQIENILRKGIKNINMISAALYFRPSCESGMNQDTSFYFRPLGRKKAFNEFSSVECERIKKDEGKKQRDLFLAYYRGEKEIPKKTNGTELRQVYNFFRVNEHCFEGDANFPRAEKVLFTLFYNDLKKNFGEYYENDGTLNGFRFYLDSLNNEFDTAYDDYINTALSKKEFLEERSKSFFEPLSEEIKEVQVNIDSIRSYFVDKYDHYPPYTKNTKNDKYKEFSEEDKKIYDNYYNNLSYLNDLHNTFEREDYDETDNDGIPNFVSSYIKALVDDNDEKLADRDKKKVELRKELSDVEVPNAEFFAKAGRDEILKHAHKVEQLTSHEFFGKYGAVNTRYKYVLEEKLVNMRCLPFEWHEYSSANASIAPRCADDFDREDDRFLRN